jgi:serine/threonine protein kinase
MEDGNLRGKVADFGLAYLKKVSSDMSKSNPVRHNGGTEIYQAPELFQMNSKIHKGKSVRLLARLQKCDLFAAGIIFLELITLWPIRSILPVHPAEEST